MAERPRLNENTKILKLYLGENISAIVTDNGEFYQETIYIDKVQEKGSPNPEKFKCVCCEHGIVKYSNGPIETSNGKRHIIIGSIYAYRCDSCEFSAHLPAIEKEIREIINLANL